MSVAAIFPGQGSQSVGMGLFLYENFSSTRTLFEEASDCISINMKKTLFEDPEGILNNTEITQPALLLTSICAFTALSEVSSFKPTLSAGHSVGEYAALVSTNVISFADGMRSVHYRGQVMQKAVPLGKGGMVAIMGMDEDQVAEFCAWAQSKKSGSVLEIANLNAPGQIVVSGHQDLITWAIENFKTDVLKNPPSRAKLIPLKVSAPFHCSLMLPAEEQMATFLDSIAFSSPSNPIVQNVSAIQEDNSETIKRNIIHQVSNSVKWIESVHFMASSGITQTVELGSGKVLSGLVKKIDSERITTFNMNSMEELKELERVFK